MSIPKEFLDPRTAGIKPLSDEQLQELEGMAERIFDRGMVWFNCQCQPRFEPFPEWQVAQMREFLASLRRERL